MLNLWTRLFSHDKARKAATPPKAVEPPALPSLAEMYAELLAVAPAIAPMGHISGGLGHNPWKAILRTKVVRFIEWHQRRYHRLPVGEYVIETGDIAKVEHFQHGGEIYFRNLIRFPNVAPPLADDGMSLALAWPINCDAAVEAFGRVSPIGSAPVSPAMSLLRKSIHFGRCDWTIRDLFLISTGLALQLDQEERLFELAATYNVRHGYPPNLVKILHELITQPSMGSLDSQLCERIRELHDCTASGAAHPGDNNASDIRHSLTKTILTQDGLYQTVTDIPDLDRWLRYLDRYPHLTDKWRAPVGGLVDGIAPGCQVVDLVSPIPTTVSGGQS